jgi:peptidyl-dipeptidase Dcp
MPDFLYSFLSLEFSGLILAVLVGAIGTGMIWLAGSRLVRFAGMAVAALALVMAAGSISHLVRYAALQGAYPAPGEMVDIGGYDVHVLAEGPQSSATLVWFAGGHAGGVGFIAAHDDLSADYRSVLIDRPGTGWSDTGPFPRTTAREAEEMMAALEAAGEEGPFVWIGHSFGGLLAANLGRRYPDETAAVILLDPTPTEVVMYGLDRQGLGSLERMTRNTGLRTLFGLYDFSNPEPAIGEDGNPDYSANPFATLFALARSAGQNFAAASIYEELTAEGLIPRSWDTSIFEGDLGDIPLYLVAPQREPSIDAYAASVAGADSEDAERFTRFLHAVREYYLRASSNSHRIVAPEGTGHNFVYERPDFLTDTVRGILSELDLPDPEIQALIDWPGPYGGLPPVDRVTPEHLAEAYAVSLDRARSRIAAITSSPEPADFDNTILAYERAMNGLEPVASLLALFTSTARTPEWNPVAAQIGQARTAFDSQVLFDGALFDRINTVFRDRDTMITDPVDRRLVEVIHDRFVREGAALDEEAQDRLTEINARLTELQGRFVQNVMADEAQLVVFIESETGLSGLNDDQIAAARAAAEDRNRPDAWAIPINRPAVWPFMQQAENRELRREVWELWMTRGGRDGDNDNRPVINEIIRLRGEKARLLGFDNFADYQTHFRMAGTPEMPLDLMMNSWNVLLGATEAELADMQAIADEDGDFIIQNYDRLYYRERLRQARYDFDLAEIEPYLSLENVRGAMFWSAEQAYGMTFRRLEDVATVAAGIEVYEVRRNGDVLGVLWLDLFQREGKGPSSWAGQYRSASSFNDDAPPLVVLHSAAPAPVDGQPALLRWERANVIFHEFGHTLQTLSNTAPYPSLDPLNLPWDFIEVPSLFHERWFSDPELRERFLVHYETGEPIPDDLLQRFQNSLDFDRVFSMTLDYLSIAIVDLRLHMLADGSDVDVMDVQSGVLEELGMPDAVDPLLSAPHAFHTFSPQYAAGVYTYYWSDVIAADIAEAFLETPEGLHNSELNTQFRELVLDAGNMIPPDEAFRRFRGRDPDPQALHRRFGLASGD